MKRSFEPTIDLLRGVVRAAAPCELKILRHPRALDRVSAGAGLLVVCFSGDRLGAADIVGEIQQQVMRMRGRSRAQPRVVANRTKPVAAAIEVDALEPGHRRCACRDDRGGGARGRWCRGCSDYCERTGVGRGRGHSRRLRSEVGGLSRRACSNRNRRLDAASTQGFDSTNATIFESVATETSPHFSKWSVNTIAIRIATNAPTRRFRRQRRRFCASGSMNRYGGAPPKRNTSPCVSRCVRRIRRPLTNVPGPDLRSTT